MDREDLRNQVRMGLPPEVSDVADAMIDTLLNQGLEEVAAWADWPWLETSATMSAVDSTRTIALPGDFLKAIKLVDDDWDYAVPYVSKEKLFTLVGNDTGNENTRFQAWTIYGTNVMLSPIPQANDTNRFTIYYYKTPTTLSTDGASPEFPAAFHMMLVEYAKWKLYEREALVEQAQIARSSFQAYLGEMQAYYNNRITQSPSIYGGGKRPRFRGHPNIPWWPFNYSGN